LSSRDQESAIDIHATEYRLEWLPVNEEGFVEIDKPFALNLVKSESVELWEASNPISTGSFW
jgi:hypothetical protein